MGGIRFAQRNPRRFPALRSGKTVAVMAECAAFYRLPLDFTMTTHSTSSTRALTALVGIACLFATAAFAADAVKKPASKYAAPRTEFGQPNLQGVWTNATLTPLEREARFADKPVLSDAEAAAVEKEQADFRDEADKPTDPTHGIQDLPKDCGGGFSGVDCGYNNFWVDPGTKLITLNGQKRTSIITDPPNGKMPARTPAGQAQIARMYAAYRSGSEGPESRPLGERCLMSFDSSAGPPMLPLLYNNNYQIVQTADTVMILVEMVHDTRVIRLNGKRRPDSVRLWMGESIGHWEGDTLVVETTGFRRDQSFRGTSENMKVTERFTRVSPKQIEYKFTVDDPTNFTKSFSGEVAMNASDEMIYEYACHEGNYALPGILAGARAAEKEAAAKKK
jgi:hypothetical protein